MQQEQENRKIPFEETLQDIQEIKSCLNRLLEMKRKGELDQEQQFLAKPQILSKEC